MKKSIVVSPAGNDAVGIMSTMADLPTCLTSYTVLCVRDAEDLAQQLLQVCQDIRKQMEERAKPRLHLVKDEVTEPNTGTLVTP